VKLIRITIKLIYVGQRLFIIWSFTVTCVLYFYPTIPNSNVLGKSPIRDSNNIGKLEIAIGGFGRNTIHTIGGEGPYL
jgi:hypothetical protein